MGFQSGQGGQDQGRYSSKGLGPSFCESDLLHSEIQGRETCYTITAEDIRRELSIEPLVQLGKFHTHEEKVQRTVVNEPCPQCHHPQLEYYTKQLRSADEGQTVFYECPKCRHKFSLNT